MRSTPAIVQHADAMIQRNQNRYKKHMIPFRTQNIPIRHTTLTDRSQQSNYLLNIARNCQEETAILYRNHDSILPLLDLLEREGIPYQCRQMEHNFFSHFIVSIFRKKENYKKDRGSNTLANTSKDPHFKPLLIK